MKRAVRQLVADEIGFLNTNIVHVHTQMARINRLYGEGMTDKEKNYLSHRVEALNEEVEKIHKLWERMHHSVGKL